MKANSSVHVNTREIFPGVFYVLLMIKWKVEKAGEIVTNTKEQIIKTMYSLVAKYGYDKASIGKISKIIGISKPAIYYYFDNKEDIFVEIIRKIYPVQKGSEKQYIDNLNSKEDLRNILLRLGLSQIQNYKGDVERQRFLSEVNVQTSRIPRIKEYRDLMDQENYNVWKTVLVAANKKGLFDKKQIDLKASELFILSAGISYTIADGEKDDAFAVWKDAIDHLIVD